VNKSADNYLKLTVREGKTLRDTILPFRSADRAECVDALSTMLGLVQARGGTISVYDAGPFARMGEAIPQIGEWPANDIRRHALEPEEDEPANALPPAGTFH
jgi:hypothetical protein